MQFSRLFGFLYFVILNQEYKMQKNKKVGKLHFCNLAFLSRSKVPGCFLYFAFLIQEYKIQNAIFPPFWFFVFCNLESRIQNAKNKKVGKLHFCILAFLSRSKVPGCFLYFAILIQEYKIQNAIFPPFCFFVFCNLDSRIQNTKNEKA